MNTKGIEVRYYGVMCLLSFEFKGLLLLREFLFFFFFGEIK